MLNKLVKEEAIERYKLGEPASTISESLGISCSNLMCILRKNGVKIRVANYPISPKQENKMRELRKNGKTIPQLADLFKVSKSTIQYHIYGSQFKYNINKKLKSNKGSQRNKGFRRINNTGTAKCLSCDKIITFKNNKTYCSHFIKYIKDEVLSYTRVRDGISKRELRSLICSTTKCCRESFGLIIIQLYKEGKIDSTGNRVGGIIKS